MQRIARMSPRSFIGRCTRIALCTFALVSVARAQDPFADAVTSFTVGSNGGFNSAALPHIVLGAPLGAGQTQGSTDVGALGSGGSIVLRFDLPVICDGPGADFTVFENAFHSGSPSGPLFTEYGFVAVSQDGVNFISFPFDASTHAGLAGQAPVLSHPSNGIDPLDPAVSGGDQFDLATLGLSWVSYVRITDVAGAVPDVGDLPQFAIAPNAGFDLDALAALHGCDPAAQPSPTPTATAIPPTATATSTSTATHSPAVDTPTASATPTASPTPVATHDAVVSGRKPLRINIRSGQPSASKRIRVKLRNADANGETAIQLNAAGCAAITAISIDFDKRLAGAQDSSLIRAGRTRAAQVTVTLAASEIDTPDRTLPASCALTVTAHAAGVDPQPLDNSAVIELRVLDHNDF